MAGSPSPAARLRALGRGDLGSLYLPSLVGGLVGKLTPFVAVFSLAWQLSPAEFGVLSAGFLVCQSLSGLFVSAVLPTVNRQVAGFRALGVPIPVRSVLGNPLRLAAVTSGLGLIAAPPAVALIAGIGADWRYCIAGVLSGGAVLLEAALCVYAGMGQVRRGAFAEAVSGLIGGLLVFVGGSLAGPIGAVVGSTLGPTMVAICLTARFFSQSPAGISHVATSEVRGSRDFGRVAVMSVIGNASVQVGLWSLQLSLARGHGLAVLGAFGLANRFATAALLLPTFLTRNLTGRLSSHAHTGKWHHFASDLKRYLAAAIGLSVLAGGVALVASVTIFDDIFSEFSYSVAFLFVLVLSSLPGAVNTALGVALVASGRWRAWAFTDVVFALISTLWVMLCVASNATPVIIVTALPVAYGVLVVLRSVLVAPLTFKEVK